MKIVTYQNLKGEFKRVLLRHAFSEEMAEKCATIFANNSRDGVNSHGINRFSVFIKDVEAGHIHPENTPILESNSGIIEHWNGNFAPGMYNASFGMDRAIALSKEHGIGVVTMKNTNHWMRAGTYGWQAADQNCIGICFTNTIGCMPPWGGKEPRLGNNPLVIAVPRKEGNIVLDMALARYSYGKLQEYQFKEQQLPFEGGYDEEGKLTKDPYSIRKSMRPLPIGFWKGSGLALMLDIVLVALSGGNSTKRITETGADTGVTQCFIAIHKEDYFPQLIEEILSFTRSSSLMEGFNEIRYPGERVLATRLKNLKDGIPVNEKKWQQLLAM